ncbi:hypothetical protein E1265_29760 [Streptomyces sp. 8K308]|uniref:hypothetical protein n=1 Tax=Streptomyces sp. 8K308 TaxID=2530388 RepID=UPI0010476245|nr:hypothetical protein [Streptomyces sp. 8K308]TDC12508.1 hypothetical protein E1265_29760 [Streptomyces sp. 8K308]
MRRQLAGAVALIPLALMLALTGCGGGDGGEGSESGGSEDPEEAMLEFAQCMRDNGVGMSDPGAGEGMFLAPSDAGDDEMNAAMEACQDLMPGGGPPEVTDEMLDAAVEHAECMRENGIDGFPDPDPNGGGSRLDEEISDDPDWDAAEAACDSYQLGGSAQEEGGE